MQSVSFTDKVAGGTKGEKKKKTGKKNPPRVVNKYIGVDVQLFYFSPDRL